jgi:hypothetical protein
LHCDKKHANAELHKPSLNHGASLMLVGISKRYAVTGDLSGGSVSGLRVILLYVETTHRIRKPFRTTHG